ncbi:rCG63423 [Rattus norvegicus]|uniref:RCG63423 n=1 Tax=Rattus norvegicus TaxID=10116 RepID=A6IMM2_RAT|nr:rCG63423 [Rattus norvegicus]
MHGHTILCSYMASRIQTHILILTWPLYHLTHLSIFMPSLLYLPSYLMGLLGRTSNSKK